jgi:hypothetical protein
MMPWKKTKADNFAELLGAILIIGLLVGIGFALSAIVVQSAP